MHETRVIHRDVKPENILFDDQGRPVVCDFGLSRQFGRTRAEKPWQEEEAWAHGEAEDEAEHGLVGDSARAAVGTASYLAPEVWRSERYSYAVDVWSFGVTLFLALTGKVCSVLTIVCEVDNAQLTACSCHSD